MSQKMQVETSNLQPIQKMKAILFVIACSLILGFRRTLCFIIGGLIGYLLGSLFVLSGSGRWVIPVLTIAMALALAGKVRNLLDNLFY